MPQLDCEKCDKGKEKDDYLYEYKVGQIKVILPSHKVDVVPIDVTRFISYRYFDGLSVDLQKMGVFVVLPQKIVPVVLILESDVGLASEASQIGLTNISLQIFLAKIHHLLVYLLDLT